MQNHKKKLSKRKQAVQDLVKTQAITDQAELLDLLQTQYNIQTNQAAISRDLRSLGISKQVRQGQAVYELPQIDVVGEIMRYAVKSINYNEVMIIINTVSGTADVVGDFVDAQDDLPVLGTLAGENVVFVTPVSIKNIKELAAKLALRIKIKK
jgi:transcriptional regulator of arginine metabolism